MPAISKQLFYERMSSPLECYLVHPWSDSCLLGNGRLMAHSFVGCSKFFLPVYLVQAILGAKVGVDIRSLLKGYVRSVLYGVCFTTTFVIYNCILRNTIGSFKYYNIGLTSGFLAGLSVFFESPNNRTTSTLLFFNLVIEAAINNLEWLGFFKRSNLKDTLAFMACSSFLPYLFRTLNQKPCTNLWFYPPPRMGKKEVDDEKKKAKLCQHKRDCWNYFLLGFAKYFCAGYAVEIIRFLLGKFNLLLKNPMTIFFVLFNPNNFKFGLVTGGYVAIYRVITCLLLNVSKKDRTYHHVLAGFLSGSTYFIKPNIQFGITAITTIIQLVVQRLLPLSAISPEYNGFLFAVFNALLFHNRFMYPETCPKYTKNMINVCTNGLGDQIINLLTDLVISSG